MTMRVGFFGGGFIARFHAAMLRGGDEAVEIVAVHDPNQDTARDFAESVGAQVASSEEALLGQVDAVYVCTWTSEHPRLVAAATERGLPVFCEKPLAVDLATAEVLASTVLESGVTNQVGLVLRDSPAFALARLLVNEPGSGPVMTVVFRDDQYLPVQGIYGSTWRADPARAGSGTLLEHSVHDVDLLEWLFGTIDTVSAHVGDTHGLLPIEDSATVLARFTSGATATLTSVWHDVLSRPSQRRVEVFCQRSWIAVEGDVFGPVRWTRQIGPGHDDVEENVLEGTELLDELARRGHALRNPDAAFVAAAREGSVGSPSVAEALRAQVVVDAIYRSARAGGNLVRVPSPAS